MGIRDRRDKRRDEREPNRPLMAPIVMPMSEHRATPGHHLTCSLSERVPQISPEQLVESAPPATERGAVGRRPGT